MRLPFLFNFTKLSHDWEFSHGLGYNDHGDVSTNEGKFNRWVKLVNAKEDVTVIVNYDLRAVKPKDSNWGFQGTTLFEKGCSFDRLGVESSFTISDKRLKDKFYGKYYTLEDAALGELKRVQERAARIKEAGGFVTIPDLGWKITAARKVELINQLKTKGYFHLTPSGFGTGYNFFTSRMQARRNQYSAMQATVKQREFFGANELYYSTMECD
jgi:hypothetical protein